MWRPSGLEVALWGKGLGRSGDCAEASDAVFMSPVFGSVSTPKSQGPERSDRPAPLWDRVAAACDVMWPSAGNCDPDCSYCTSKQRRAA